MKNPISLSFVYVHSTSHLVSAGHLRAGENIISYVILRGHKHKGREHKI